MNAKKIFLTTISDLKDRKDIDYYVCGDDAEHSTYTTAMSITEAGIKYIISKYDIDEIIVLGNKCNASTEEKSVTKLSSMNVKNIANLNMMSEYGFLRYRVSEFMNQLDFELLDIAESIDSGSEEKLKILIQDFKDKNNISSDKDIFYKLCVDNELYNKFKNEILDKCSLEEQKCIKHYFYSQMDACYKMHIKDNNVNSSIKYIDIKDKDLLSIETITDVFREVFSEENKEIDLYIDLQSLTPTDGNILINTFLMANRRIGYKCDIKELINTRRNTNAFAGLITDAFYSYKIQKLLEGLNLFLDYGKDKVLKEFWQTLGIEDEMANKIFAGMDCIDEGIGLCNVDLIIYGIRYIKKEIEEYDKLVEFHNIYSDIVVNAIKADYGKMLIGDDINLCDLLEWALKKGFYQQILTLIESKIPDDMVKRGIYYYARDEKDVEDYLQKVNDLYWKEQFKMRWSFNEVNHYFIKLYGRFAIDSKQKPELVAKDYANFRIEVLKCNREDIAKAYSDLNNDKFLFDLLYAYYIFGKVRNKVNHAEVMEFDLDGDAILHRKDLRDEISAGLVEFIDIYKRVCDEVKCEKKPLIITNQQFREYTKNHDPNISNENN